MSDKQRQEDELEVLQSIYDREVRIESRWPSSGCLYISPDPLTEDFDMNVVSILNEKSAERTVKLRYLAPIELYFKCPNDYPSTSQPLFMLRCIWLSENSLTSICRNFDSIWDRTRSEILYDWAYSLKDCCSFLKIERLNFITEVFDKSKVIRTQESTRNLKLKELRNKSSENKDRGGSHRELRSRRSKLRGNFKYETPKDMEIPTEKIISDFAEENKQNDISHSVTEPTSNYEFILSMLPRFGVRRKTIHREYDSRVVPNRLHTKEEQRGIHTSSIIVQKMIDYNDECITRAFRHESHSCDICLNEKLGSMCVRMQLCGHIFCRDCIAEYLRANITDGNLRALQCPRVGCGASVTDTQIRHCVNEALYKKFEQFMFKMTVEDDPDLMYCPRNVCQSVARRCSELGDDLYYCSKCSYYFCMYCKKAYHGVQPCQLQDEARLLVINEYLNADSIRQNELEKRYTKKQICKWVDEHLSAEWIETSSSKCPNCGVPIQKNEGCNKMICSKCNIPFCWLCNECLNTQDPYKHFSDPFSTCYQKLFAGTVEEYELFEDEDDDFVEDLYFE